MEEAVVGRVNDPGNKELIAYINRVGALLSAKKKKAILEADLLKTSRETQYIRLRVEEIQKKIDLDRASLDEITPGLAESKNKLEVLEREKKPLEDEYNHLHDIQVNFEEKRADVENKKAMIERLTMDIENHTKEFEALEDREFRTTARMREIQEGNESNRSKLSALNEEIEVMSTTRDLVSGKIPDFIDIEEFPSLVNADPNSADYESDVKDAMKVMQNDISTFSKDVEKSYDLEKSLHLEQKGLESGLEKLESKTTPGIDKGRLTDEVADLSKRKETLTDEITAYRENISRVQPMVAEQKTRLETERTSNLALDERIRDLKERRQFISTLDDVDVEMQRLRGRIMKSGMGLEANKGCMAVINRVMEDTGAINRKMEMSLEVYGDALLVLQRILLLKHSISYGNGAV
jgi:chromosome segregation ATPase